MAKKVLLNCYTELSGTDVTSYVAKVELEDTYEEKETTNFGSGGAKEVLGGLESGTLGLTFRNDFSGGSLDSIMWTMRSRTPVTFKVRAEKDSIVSSANPQYSGSVLVNGWKFGGSVGDVAEVDISYPLSGTVTRSTTT